EKIETGKFLIMLDEDEEAILRAVCQKIEFGQSQLVSRLLGNALRSIYHLFFPSKWLGEE
ncbi:unnamed protein product, partial [marine sediment metagenome]